MKKIGLICLTLVMALGMLGATFALWSDVLFLDATVETGSIGLAWSQGDPIDDETKDFSRAECNINGNMLTITVFNAYPCITYTIPIDLHVTGTIPVHCTFNRVAGGTLLEKWITMPAWDLAQLHPGDDPLMGDVVIHLDNDAAQGDCYTVSYELVYWQYNEDGP